MLALYATGRSVLTSEKTRRFGVRGFRLNGNRTHPPNTRRQPSYAHPGYFTTKVTNVAVHR